MKSSPGQQFGPDSNARRSPVSITVSEQASTLDEQHFSPLSKAAMYGAGHLADTVDKKLRFLPG